MGARSIIGLTFVYVTLAITAMTACTACGAGDVPRLMTTDPPTAPPTAAAPSSSSPTTTNAAPTAPIATTTPTNPNIIPCDKSPCAQRPIIFVHGTGGGNSDAEVMFNAMIAEKGERWDKFHNVGNADHQAWVTRSIPRREWLFTHDYYLKNGNDKRGSYTAGPGRIGSDATYTCASPVAGKGHLSPDDGSYDNENTHEYAADLAAMVDDVLRATGSSTVDIVAHSMGGLVTRSYLTFLGGNAKVEHVLFLASPHFGVPFATLANVVFDGPSWMTAHEYTELDQGSFVAKSKFTRCGAPSSDKDAWPKLFLTAEDAAGIKPDFHCMTGTSDILVTYDSGHHPKCVDHQVLDGVDHGGMVRAPESISRVRFLLGGLVTAATPF